jgi:hypothetical protein
MSKSKIPMVLDVKISAYSRKDLATAFTAWRRDLVEGENLFYSPEEFDAMTPEQVGELYTSELLKYLAKPKECRTCSQA